MSSRQSPVQEQEVQEGTPVEEDNTEESQVNDAQEEKEKESERKTEVEEQQAEEEDNEEEINVDESQSLFAIIESLKKESEAVKIDIESKNGEEIAQESIEINKKVKRMKRELQKAIAYQSKLSENQNFIDDINKTLKTLISKVKSDDTQGIPFHLIFII